MSVSQYNGLPGSTHKPAQTAPTPTYIYYPLEIMFLLRLIHSTTSTSSMCVVESLRPHSNEVCALGDAN